MKHYLSVKASRFFAFLFDFVAIGLAFTGAYLIRFDFTIPAEHMSGFKTVLPWVFVIQAPVFFLLGLYRGIWSFASLRDLFVIIRASFVSVLLTLAFVAMTHRLTNWPRSIFLIDAVLLVVILGGGRLFYRFVKEGIFSEGGRKRRVLIIGAGKTANFIARELSLSDRRAKIVGYLDDKPRLIGLKIQNAPVLGPLSTLSHWISNKRVDEIIIAIPGLRGKMVKEIVYVAKSGQIPCRICPPIRSVVFGKINLSHLRAIDVEDLLRRDVVKVDEEAIRAFLCGKRVLITGAGGSIGSELCRQVMRYEPEKVIFFERSEFNLYRLEKEFRGGVGASTGIGTSVEQIFVIGDILDQRRLDEVFERHAPQIILHAAAYKHVPLMEENPYEALQNNVVGTCRVAETAARFGVEKFVLISTDKAVRPSSIMGATKRMAELVCHGTGRDQRMCTLAVRFGNVLDSEGSVLPLFRKQILQGGPVTVTHPEATRYFMTIPEASMLVLQAACEGKGGEVFLLDMGDPVRIKDLAEELIALSGLAPYKDIDIVFTGLRKGEKLHEELLSDFSNAEKTNHPKIVVSAREYDGAIPKNWHPQVEKFADLSQVPSRADLMHWIAQWVPEYTTHTTEVADEPSVWPAATDVSQQLH